MGKGIVSSALITLFLLTAPAWGMEGFATDRIETAMGVLEMTFIGHGTLMFSHNGKIIHIDPWSKLADYSKLPKADLILITHEHGDHLDLAAIEMIRKKGTQVMGNPAAALRLPGAVAMINGETKTVLGVGIEAVPAYNLIHKRPSGEPFHPQGNGNGYVLTLGGKRIYVAGDTENIPEMKELRAIDCAFLPMNLPYTMTPEMTAAAARLFRPRILYPYHYGETDPKKLEKLLHGSGIEVRIRDLR